MPPAPTEALLDALNRATAVHAAAQRSPHHLVARILARHLTLAQRDTPSRPPPLGRRTRTLLLDAFTHPGILTLLDANFREHLRHHAIHSVVATFDPHPDQPLFQDLEFFAASADGELVPMPGFDPFLSPFVDPCSCASLAQAPHTNSAIWHLAPLHAAAGLLAQRYAEAPAIAGWHRAETATATITWRTCGDTIRLSRSVFHRHVTIEPIASCDAETPADLLR